MHDLGEAGGIHHGEVPHRGREGAHEYPPVLGVVGHLPPCELHRGSGAELLWVCGCGVGRGGVDDPAVDVCNFYDGAPGAAVCEG